MKYYAVTEDPRELYHYGVKGMKWGQHIFGDKPKSPGYHKAVKKLKSLSTKASKATAKSVSTVGQAVKKSAQQMLYNARAAQQKRFEKSVQKAQANLDRTNVKYDNWQEKQVQTAAVKQINKAIHKVKVEKAKQNASNALRTVGQTAAKMPGQISENVRKLQEAQYQKAVKKAQDRNKLSDALRGLDKEEKLIKQVNRDRKMEELREKHADIMADNDLKTMQKAVRVEKNMPRYYQEARTGQLKYGKLSDEQIGRLQNRLALEANTRRLGSTEEPSWREQKKQARRQGYLQGITKGISAGMEEVARAGVQYGIRNLANRKKMDAASELKAEREKNANRIKNKKTHREIDQDIKQETYEQRVREGENVFRRNNPFLSTARQASHLSKIKDTQRERQDKISDAREERKFLMEEQHNKIRDERQSNQKLSEQFAKVDKIGESIYKYGVAAIPVFNKDGKQIDTKLLDAHDRDGASYLKLYKVRHKEEITAYEKEQKQAEKVAEDRAKKEAQRELARQKIRNEALEDQKRRQQRDEEITKLGEQIIAENERKNLERKIQKTLNKSINNTVISDRPIVSITQRDKNRDERYPRGSVGYADDIGLFIPKRRRRRSDR